MAGGERFAWLDDLVHRADRPTVRAGEQEGWAYTVQTALDVADREDDQLGRLSLGGEAFALVYILSSVTFAYASNQGPTWFFDMTLPRLREPNPRFEAAIAEAGFLDGLPRAGINGPRFVELAFGVTLTRAMIEGPLPSIARPTGPPPALHLTLPPMGWPEPRPRGHHPQRRGE